MSAPRGACPIDACTDRHRRDKAAVFTELDSGTLWYCHRCEASRWIDDDQVECNRNSCTRLTVSDAPSVDFAALRRSYLPDTWHATLEQAAGSLRERLVRLSGSQTLGHVLVATRNASTAVSQAVAPVLDVLTSIVIAGKDAT